MSRTLDDDLNSGFRLKPLILAMLKNDGRDFTKCEFCGTDIPKGKYIVHHTKYDGATYHDLRIICFKCDKQPENRNLI